MKILVEIDIARPQQQVWTVFSDASRLHEWQATLKSFEAISGEPGQVGSVARFVYREGGRDVVMRETILERVEGQRFVQRLEAEMMSSVMRNGFSSPRSDTTRWTLECDIAFRGAWKFLGLLARPLLVKKTRDDMERFRRLAEQTGGAANSSPRPPSDTLLRSN